MSDLKIKLNPSTPAKPQLSKDPSKKKSKPSSLKKKPASDMQPIKSNHLMSFRPKHWEQRWVLFPNVFDHVGEIWLKKWVAMDEVEEEMNFQQETSPSYKCMIEDCGKVFSDAMSLKKHAQTHGERQFVCTYEDCGKKFLDNSKLRRHQLVHTGERPYECQYCHKKFSLDFNLRTHLRTHTGEKPYQCSYPGCLKRFTQSSNLAAHEKTHHQKTKKEE